MGLGGQPLVTGFAMGGDPAPDGPVGHAEEGGDILLLPALADPLDGEAASGLEFGR